MKKYFIASIAVLLLLWQLASILVHNDVLIPSVFQVLAKMSEQISNPLFLQIVLATCTRTAVGLFFSFIIALVLGIAAGKNEKIKAWIAPVATLCKAIPNVSYIILALIWLGSEKSVALICFFVLFPIFYTNILLAFEQEEAALRNVSRLYYRSFWDDLLHHIFPMLKPYLLSAFQNAVGMGLKVAVMAEILGQVKVGIGKQMSLSRIYLDTTSLLAWTIWVLVLTALGNLLFQHSQREGG